MERNRANLSVKKGINYFFTSKICFDFLLKLFCCRFFTDDITACHIILLFVRRRGVQFAFYQKGNYGNCLGAERLFVSQPLGFGSCRSALGYSCTVGSSCTRLFVYLALHALGSSRTRLFMHSAFRVLGSSCLCSSCTRLFAYSALRVSALHVSCLSRKVSVF